MNDIVPVPAYAIYRDVWQGVMRWQAYYLAETVHFPVQTNGLDLQWSESELPVSPPCESRADALLDVKLDWRQRGNLSNPIVEANDRLHDWTSLRRNL